MNYPTNHVLHVQNAFQKKQTNKKKKKIDQKSSPATPMMTDHPALYLTCSWSQDICLYILHQQTSLTIIP